MKRFLVKLWIVPILFSATINASEIDSTIAGAISGFKTGEEPRGVYFGLSQFHSGEVKKGSSINVLLSSDSIFNGRYINGQLLDEGVLKPVRFGTSFTVREGFYADFYGLQFIFNGFGGNLQYQYYGDYKQHSKPGNFSQSIAVGARKLFELDTYSTSTNYNVSWIAGYRLTENLLSNFSVSYQYGENSCKSDRPLCEELSGENIILTLNAEYKLTEKRTKKSLMYVSGYWSLRVGVSQSFNDWYEIDNTQTNANLELFYNF